MMVAYPLVGVAVALLLWPTPRWRLHRLLAERTSSNPLPDNKSRRQPPDPFGIAAVLDEFAVCLRAGLPVSAAAAAVARSAPVDLGMRLARAAELLALGADPERAWQASDSDPIFDQLASLARRSARSGSSLSAAVAELAAETRQHAHDQALAAAERAGVAISGPLGLCFLPAFVCLGIVPVVIGLAGTALNGL